MATKSTGNVILQLCRSMLQKDGSGLTDGELLTRFVEQRDPVAFEVLVHRHGSMVLGVCQRVLNHSQDAEDTFQAAFLVLARKAASVQPRDMVGNWLYGVAYQTSLKARAVAARRHLRERQVSEMPEPAAVQQDEWNDLRPLLDRELSRLPDKYRVPIVLCDLEGKGHKEAADQLGWPQGTLSGRLSRARDLLAKRLRRHGLGFAAVPLAILLSERASSAAVPFAAIDSTTKAAIPIAAGQATAGLVSTQVAALMEGVMRTMLIAKLKIATAAALFVAMLAGYGTGAFNRDAQAERPKDDLLALNQERRKPAPDGGGRGGADVQGIIKSVDAAKSTITLAGSQGRGGDVGQEDKTYTLAKDVEVVSGDGSARRGFYKEIKVAELAVGSIVSLSLSADQNTVESIAADGPTIRGPIKSIDVPNNTVTIITSPGSRDGAEATEKTFTIAVNAEIGIDDGRGKRFSVKEGKIGDLSQGALATLYLSADQKLAQVALVEGLTLTGAVKSVDVSKNLLTLTSAGNRRGGGDAEEKTLELAKDIVLLIDDGKGRRLSVKEGKLADVPVGSVVQLKLSVNQQQIMSLLAQGPILHGQIKAVDASKGTITVAIQVGRGDNPDERTLNVAKDAKIMLEGNASKLGDIKIEDGTVAQVRLSLDQKTVQSIVIGGGRR